MIQRHKHQSGFTVIELMLAMGGIAFLLLFVVFAITHATNLYSKGVAIRQINQVGRQLGDEVARQMRYGGKPTIVTAKNRLCVGGKSYIWNNANAVPSDPNTNKTAGGTVVGFMRLDGTSYCSASSPAIPDTTPELLGGVARLMRMTVTEPVTDSGVYEINMVYGTALAQPVLVSGNYECPVNDGQFCAVGEFDVVVYARGDKDAQ